MTTPKQNERKNLSDGELENDKAHRCRQTQCEFFLNGGCRKCDDCASAPYEINNACSRCDACENVPNSLRWGDKKLISIGQKNKPKEQLMEVTQ